MNYPKCSTLFAVVVFLLLATQQGFAQRNPDVKAAEEEAERAERVTLKEKLWYGGSLSLGFGSFNGQSNFGFGLAPMVGYKFWGPFSAGPRLSVFMSSQKYPGYKSVTLFNTELGLFLRAKVFRGFFLQGEVANEWVQEPFDVDPVDKTIIKRKFTRGNQYIGAGYNFGGGPGTGGSEISILYNLAIANDINAYEQPWDYRFGFTYNF